MKSSLPHVFWCLAALGALLAPEQSDGAAFTPGNLAVLRVGEGGAALSGTATPVFIEEYLTAGGPAVQVIGIPAVGATKLTLSGSATSEGALTRSPGGALLCFAGYQADAGTAGVAGTTSAAVPREIGTLDPNGTFAVAASTATQFNASSIRSGVADGAGNFWAGGTATPTTTGGINYLGTASPPAQVLGGNLRWAAIFNGNLYFSSGSATPGTGIHQFTGLPVTAAASAPVNVAVGQSPYGFSIDSTGARMYVADDRSIASGGGIQRWKNGASGWVLEYTLGTGAGSTGGVRGLVVDWGGASPVVYATTTETNNNRLISVTDTGAASVAATIASAGANKAFRGVSFVPAVPPRTPKPHYFANDLLPPPNGVDVSDPAAPWATFPNGVVIRSFSHRGFSQSLPPPPPGGSQLHQFDAAVAFELSTDGGQSFSPYSATAHTSVRVSYSSDSGSFRYFDTEMLQLDLTGGSLPAGVMIRESPTRASTGRTSIERLGGAGGGGGYMIDSFFDIFTELSVDGGQSWQPAPQSGHTDLSVDPIPIAPVKAPTDLWPPPNDFFASTAPPFAAFPQGIVLRNVKQRFFSESLPLPALGSSQVQNYDAQVDMEISIDGGQTFSPVRTPAAAAVRVTHSRNEGTTQIFDTEMLALNLSGGGLPAGVLIRESPTRASHGGTARSTAPPGDPDFDLLRIGSFFDIFTELSLDGGQSWTPATTPGHLELQCNAPEMDASSPNLPPPGGQYSSVGTADAVFPSGTIIKGLVLGGFSQSLPPPPPGGSQMHLLTAAASFQLSTNGGQSFSPSEGQAQVQFRTTSFTDSGGTSYFETEMLSLDLLGGGLRLRESPTKASLGRTSIRQTPGGYHVSSFFDIFTELSIDGGQTWHPSTIAPAEIVIQEAPSPHFFASDLLPPPNGVYVTPADFHAAYANGIIIRNVSHKRFTQSMPPPPPGGTQIHNFGSTVELDFSVDGGQSFQHVSGPATTTVRVTSAADDGGGTRYFDTEMLQLNLSGGGLPPGIMVRESPTRASTGRTSIEPTGGGYMIDSFFDIFTELSVDGGQSWSPTTTPANVKLTVDPTLIPPVRVPNELWPPPNDFLAPTGELFAAFPQGIVLRNARHHLFSQSLPLPALGSSQTQTFDGQMDMEVSTDGGQTFVPVRAPTATTVRLTHSRDEGTTQVFDTEMLQLDLTAPGLPGGIRLRESPTRQSLGGTARAPAPPGDPDFDLLRIGSFFDIFTELSVDGGQTWTPATAPAHVELQSRAPEVAETSPHFPPPPDEFVSTGTVDASFPPGIIVKEARLDHFSQSLPPPPPGGSQIVTFEGRIRFMASVNGGLSFDPEFAPATVSLLMRSSVDEGGTRYFDTEMLQLNIQGGSLPAAFMVRESPTRASLGRTSTRQTPGSYHIDSFFDIFTELSIDGGQSWQPSTSSPMGLALHDADSDGDGLPDDWETANFGNLQQDAAGDKDADGSSNKTEELAGTNPNDPSSVLRPSASSHGMDFLLSFGTVPGHQYSIESSPDLGLTQPWLPVVENLLGDGSVRTVPLTGALRQPRQFYRVVPALYP